MSFAPTEILAAFERNPFHQSTDRRTEAGDACDALGARGRRRMLVETLEAGDLETAERLLLAFGHAEALEDVEPWEGIGDKVWDVLPSKRAAYVRIARAAARCTRHLDRLVGASTAMQRLRAETWSACFGSSLRDALRLERVIVDHDVLLLGETGTGKEALAKAIQESLPAADPNGLPARAALNAAAIPETLVESALFGHRKGAFTGADQDRLGAIRQAHSGSLFLDEVGDLPRATQVKLLRVMETDEVRPLGSDEPFPAECRYIAATHLDLEAMVEAGEFRRDLFERLAGHVLRVPPLRDRREDIPELGRHFVARYVGADELPEVWARVERWLDRARALPHRWPGNVRELQNALRSVVLGLEPPMLDAGRGNETADGIVPAAIAAGTAPLEDVEAWYLQKVLDAQGGSQSAAARVLGIDRGTVRRRLEKLD
ncbi:MAG: sigma-54-dependent Fis family transcriptional regulator [Deltaproteobacteria bacterium]|nr:sigma-54-dependent Fis family transcriptional regulator [Deltaproteobacteria bacterium]